MCRHIYDRNIVKCDVKQLNSLHFTFTGVQLTGLGSLGTLDSGTSMCSLWRSLANWVAWVEKSLTSRTIRGKHRDNSSQANSDQITTLFPIPFGCSPRCSTTDRQVHGRARRHWAFLARFALRGWFLHK